MGEVVSDCFDADVFILFIHFNHLLNYFNTLKTQLKNIKDESDINQAEC